PGLHPCPGRPPRLPPPSPGGSRPDRRRPIRRGRPSPVGVVSLGEGLPTHPPAGAARLRSAPRTGAGVRLVVAAGHRPRPAWCPALDNGATTPSTRIARERLRERLPGWARHAIGLAFLVSLVVLLGNGDTSLGPLSYLFPSDWLIYN